MANTVKVEFINVPEGTEWWDEAVEALKWAASKICKLESDPVIETQYISDSKSRVHVLITLGHDMDEREALARTIFNFLAIHRLRQGADVFFAGFGKPDYFA